jgi:hypothetical protein
MMSNLFTCPICGTEVPIKARACPECGSDKETGWSEEAQYVHLLPDRGESELSSSRNQPLFKFTIAAVALLILFSYLISSGLSWGVSLLLIGGLAAGISYVLAQSISKPGRDSEKQLYQRLLQKAGGNKALADRLVTYEQQRNPRAKRQQLLQAAIERWERDIGRR